jgi:DNA-binding SARP family transcriptional activator
MTDEQRQAKLEQLAACEKFGEEAYDAMYEEHSSSGATGRYSNAKEAFYDAIRGAHELGMTEKVEALEKRLEHIKAVFRSQFT